MNKKLWVVFSIVFASTGFWACNDAKDDDGNEVKIEKSVEERVKDAEAAIRNNPEWLAAVEKKAKEKNISLDSMIHIDASWLVDEQDGKHKNDTNQTAAPAVDPNVPVKSFEERVKDFEAGIRSDKAWMEAITQKAKDRKISVDSMIHLDATFMVQEADKKKQQ